MNSIRLCLVLHNHQPIGNFDGVFEQAYRDAYRPFLDVLEQYDFPIALHTSGPLMEWLDERPIRICRSACPAGRGGADRDHRRAVLRADPDDDSVARPRRANHGLFRLASVAAGRQGAGYVDARARLGTVAHADLADAGIKYTVLDDFHFKTPASPRSSCTATTLTEDDGRVVSIFPGSEPLRYTIPFQQPQATIDYLRGIAEACVRMRSWCLAMTAKKFGVWPETKRHVYDNGWLRQFFDALAANRDWIEITTLAEAVENVPSEGKILPSRLRRIAR